MTAPGHRIPEINFIDKTSVHTSALTSLAVITNDLDTGVYMNGVKQKSTRRPLRTKYSEQYLPVVQMSRLVIHIVTYISRIYSYVDIVYIIDIFP